MPKTVTINPPKAGDVLFNVDEKVFPTHLKWINACCNGKFIDR